jgi:hypothetical protein
MKFNLKILLFALILISSCSPNRESLPAPERPEIVPVPDPLSEIDVGSGATPEVDGIKILWKRVLNATGYKLYRGEIKTDKVEFIFIMMSKLKQERRTHFSLIEMLSFVSDIFIS